jgi:nucleoside-diphosphate-sugar epimerase
MPIIEDQPKFPLDEYGIQKAKCEEYLHNFHRQEGFPETVIMPGQISGPGWVIMNPVANHDYWIFDKIRRGEEIALPNFGMETLHHIHGFFSIEKGKRLLEYYPRHSLLETVEESVAYMVEHQWFEKQK